MDWPAGTETYAVVCRLAVAGTTLTAASAAVVITGRAAADVTIDSHLWAVITEPRLGTVADGVVLVGGAPLLLPKLDGVTWQGHIVGPDVDRLVSWASPAGSEVDIWRAVPAEPVADPTLADRVALAEAALAALPTVTPQILTPVTAAPTIADGTTVGELRGWLNTSTGTLTIGGVSVPAGQALVLMWDGTAWVQPTMVGIAPSLAAPVLTVSDVTATGAVVSWPAVAGASGYELRIDGGAISSVTSPHTLSGLSASTSYAVEVRAVGGPWGLASVTTSAPASTALRLQGNPNGLGGTEDTAGGQYSYTFTDPAYQSGGLSAPLGMVGDGYIEADITVSSGTIRIGFGTDGYWGNPYPTGLSLSADGSAGGGVLSTGPSSWPAGTVPTGATVRVGRTGTTLYIDIDGVRLQADVSPSLGTGKLYANIAASGTGTVGTAADVRGQGWA